jgi:hypothetical protein
MSQAKEQTKYTSFGTRINPDIKRNSNDPQVLEMGRRAQEMLKKTGIPKLPEQKKSE